jgi:hypothetical protein
VSGANQNLNRLLDEPGRGECCTVENSLCLESSVLWWRGIVGITFQPKKSEEMAASIRCKATVIRLLTAPIELKRFTVTAVLKLEGRRSAVLGPCGELSLLRFLKYRGTEAAPTTSLQLVFDD